MTDFMIVGRGLAAATLMHTLHRTGLSFVAIGDPSVSACSRVAAGVWHPLVFKRLTACWMYDTLIPFMLRFYDDAERVLGRKLVTARTLVRPFSEEQEKRLWLRKAGSELKGVLDPGIRNDRAYPLCNMEHGYGLVRDAGNLDVRSFLDATNAFFADRVVTERFVHEKLEIGDGSFGYGDHHAVRIVYCEGNQVQSNPYFHWVPMRPSKGEVLTVAFEKKLFSQTIVSKGGFLLDLGGGLYRAGATYAWDGLDDVPTAAARHELELKIRAITSEPYRVESHEAGVRPSSFDRRPVVGEHPSIQGMYILNGLGTRGVMLAPWFAANFVNFCRQEASLEPEADVTRFRSSYEASRKA